MASNSEIEELWIAAWNDLYAIVPEEDRCNIRCLLPDGEIIDFEACKGWLQDSAYAGYIPSVAGAWVLGKPGVIVSTSS